MSLDLRRAGRAVRIFLELDKSGDIPPRDTVGVMLCVEGPLEGVEVVEDGEELEELSVGCSKTANKENSRLTSGEDVWILPVELTRLGFEVDKAFGDRLCGAREFSETLKEEANLERLLL